MAMITVYHMADDDKEIQFAPDINKHYALAYCQCHEAGILDWFIGMTSNGKLDQALRELPPIVEGAISLSMGDWVVRK